MPRVKDIKQPLQSLPFLPVIQGKGDKAESCGTFQCRPIQYLVFFPVVHLLRSPRKNIMNCKNPYLSVQQISICHLDCKYAIKLLNLLLFISQKDFYRARFSILKKLRNRLPYILFSNFIRSNLPYKLDTSNSTLR